MPEPFAEDLAAGFTTTLFGAFELPLAADPVFMFWCSRWLSSAVVFSELGGGVGATTEALR
jgi:hypothetical protein